MSIVHFKFQKQYQTNNTGIIETTNNKAMGPKAAPSHCRGRSKASGKAQPVWENASPNKMGMGTG